MTEKRILNLIIFASFCLGLFYTFAKSPWQGYDEPQHVEIVMLLNKGYNHPVINKTGWWNVSDSDRYTIEHAIVESMERYRFWDIHKLQKPREDMSFKAIFKGANEYHQPPLYYYLCSLLTRLFDVTKPINVMFVSRLFSVLCITFGLWIFSLWLPVVFPDEQWTRIASLAIISLAPMHANLSASANNDSLVECLGFIFLGTLFQLRNQHSGKRKTILFMALIAVFLAGALTKATFYITLLLVFMVLYQMFIRKTRHHKQFTAFIQIIAMTVLFSGTFLFYLSDKFNLYQLIRLPLRVLESSHADSMLILTSPHHLMEFTRYYFKSAVGVFVFGHEFLAPPFYLLAALVVIIALTGWSLRHRSLIIRTHESFGLPDHQSLERQHHFSALLSAAVILLGIQTWIKYSINDAFFGDGHFRYTAVAYGAWACALGAGLMTALKPILHSPVTRLKVIMGTGLLYHAIVIFYYFIPLFYLPA